MHKLNKNIPRKITEPYTYIHFNFKSEEEFKNYIYKRYFQDMETTVSLSNELGISRRAIDRFFEKFGFETRSISEDNKRRYKNMTDEQKKEQTKKANDYIRENGHPELKGIPPAWINSSKREEIYKYISENRKINNCMYNEEIVIKYSKKLRENFINHPLKDEVIAIKLLKKYNINFEYQKQIGRYITDFYLTDENLIVELDALSKMGVDKKNKMWKRDDYLKSQGYKIIHFDKKKLIDGKKEFEDFLILLKKKA